MKKTLFLGLLFLSLVGCSNMNKKGLTDNIEILMSSTKETKPSWIMSPQNEQQNYPGYILVVGMSNQDAKNYDEKKLILSGENDAKLSLSEYLGVEVKGEVKSATKVQVIKNVEKFSRETDSSTNTYSNNTIIQAEPLDSYLEKIKIYRNNKWETIYNYYVLYGMPVEKNAYKKKIIKQKDDLKLLDAKDSIKKIKDMENMVEELTRNGIYATISGGYSGYSLSGFKTSESEIDILQPGISGGMNFDGELGWEKYRTSYYATAGIYTNSPLSLIRAGVGIAKKIKSVGTITLKGLADINMISSSGKVAQLNQDMEIGGKTYVAESEIQGLGTSFGFGGGIKAEYNISNNFSIFGTARYNYYMPIDKLTLTIKDKFNGSQEASVKLNSFNPIIDMSGLEFKGGLQFEF